MCQVGKSCADSFTVKQIFHQHKKQVLKGSFMFRLLYITVIRPHMNIGKRVIFVTAEVKRAIFMTAEVKRAVFVTAEVKRAIFVTA
jgi:hypothetical protein